MAWLVGLLGALVVALVAFAIATAGDDREGY